MANKKATTSENMLNPVETNDGIKVMSLNLLMESEEDSVLFFHVPKEEK